MVESWGSFVEGKGGVKLAGTLTLERKNGHQNTVDNRWVPLLSCIGTHAAAYSHKSLMGRDRVDVLLGTLEMLILQVLSRAPKLHGYDIIERLAERSGGALQVEEGALYPALHRLELKGWLSGEWKLSANNRRAKYYRLTARGRRQLEQQKNDWQRVVGVMARVLELG